MQFLDLNRSAAARCQPLRHSAIMRMAKMEPRHRQVPAGATKTGNSERKKLDTVSHLCPCHDRGYDGDISHGATDRDPRLVAVDHPGKVTPGLLPAVRENEKITILGEDNPPEFEGSLQEPIIAPVSLPVLCDGQHIDLELPQAVGNRRGHMMIQIERDAHVDSPAFRSFALAGDGSCRDAIISTSLN
jgi:hypothetical protein